MFTVGGFAFIEGWLAILRQELSNYLAVYQCFKDECTVIEYEKQALTPIPHVTLEIMQTINLMRQMIYTFLNM